ncbi:hypothetical protein G7Y79_00020g048130 [Physcia stellaris]|nr:hypothetical protein G7Y79_00020g048130 [Physcia stellaris]
MHCQYCDSELPETLTIRQHYQRSTKCPGAIRHRIAQYIQEAELASQKWQKEAELAEQEAAKLAEIEAIEAAKPTPTPVNIGIFDPTLMRDIEEFGLYSKVLGFLQHLQQIQHQYRESDVLDLLPKCVRGPAFAWFKDQTFTTIQDFGRGLACAFPTTSLEPTSKSPTPTSNPPPQYHSCVECSAQFSSLSRLLEHTKQENACSRAVCKQCEQSFNSKNKLHDHIREHHAQKPAAPPATSKNSNLRPPTPESTYKTEEKPAVICPPPPPAPPTPPATPKPISCPASISPECSHLPIATLNITPKSMEKLPANSLTPTASPPRTPVRKHQEPHTQKPYLTIDDLIRMFHGKPRPFGLHSHRKYSASPQRFGTRSPSQPRSPYQSRITAYFLPAANQKAPISQGLKSPNPKSFQQHTPAEPIRPASALPEESAYSPYKMAGISYTSLQPRSSFLQSRSSFAWPRPAPTSPPPSPPFFRSLTPDHVCCTCFGHSSFRNGLFNYPRPSQRYPSNRRPMRGVGGMVSRFGAKLGGNGG